jgi:tetrahydromethanopterin S-methyltransferase subunit B
MANRLVTRDRSSRRETERYYLLPGMGGRARKRKVYGMLVIGLLVGLFASGLLALIFFLTDWMTHGVP